ncbi:hypothetical protein D3C78_1167200 [compost metagenome]
MNRSADSNAAWVHMLNRHNCRLIEFFKNRQRRICVVNVVVGKLLAVQLLCSCYVARSGKRFFVEGCLLMRVFAVTKILYLFIRNGIGLWKRLAHLLR